MTESGGHYKLGQCDSLCFIIIFVYNDSMDKNQFINHFSLKEQGFSDPVPFSDGIGFSIAKERQQNGYTFVSIYKFFFEKDDLESNTEKKPIVISVSYAEKLNDGTLRLSPLSIKRRVNWPIDLSSTDEFFYNPSLNKFYFKSNEITAIDLVKKIESLHIKPTQPLRGSILIFKLFFFRFIITNLFKILYYALIKLLYCLAGTNTTKSIWLVNITRDKFDEEKEIKKESFAEEKIDLFGYHASAWSVVVYAILHISLYALWYFYFNFNSNFIKSVFSNAFLTMAYVIPSLVFFERIIPNILECLIRKSGEYFHKASFTKIKI